MDRPSDQPTPIQIRHSFAYYLPQYHVIPENEEWWGEGFTEWTKLRAAKRVHPRQIVQTPGELGYYDLTDVRVIGRQYTLARAHGVDTFAFWHYWFGDDDLLLQKPAEALLASSEHAEFCMAWANHDWVQRATGRTLRQQRYSPIAGKHFEYLEPFFHDHRYRKIDGRPVMILFSPSRHPHLADYVEDMHKRAQASGFPGIAFIFDHTRTTDDRAQLCSWHLNSSEALKFGAPLRRLLDKVTKRVKQKLGRPQVAEYAACAKHLVNMRYDSARHLPVAFPGWDTSIRHGHLGQVLLENTPEVFGTTLDAIQAELAGRSLDDRMFVVKSWNEWAEGNLIEPSAEFGAGFLGEVEKRFTTGKQETGKPSEQQR